jgi:hypothetical protein
VAAPNTSCGALAAWATSAEPRLCALCDREIDLFPRTVLCKARAQRVSVVQLEPGAGEEPHTQAVRDERRVKQEQERLSNQSARLRVSCPLGAGAFTDAAHAACGSASDRGSPSLSS